MECGAGGGGEMEILSLPTQKHRIIRAPPPKCCFMFVLFYVGSEVYN